MSQTVSRNITSGKTFLSPTDYQLYIDSTGGEVTVVLPKIQTIFNYFNNNSGNSGFIFGFRFKDIGNNAAVNKIVFEGMDNDVVNGVQKFDVTTNGASGILIISGINNYTFVSDVVSGASSLPCIDVTWSELDALVTGSSLVKGQKYCITDFRTRENIPKTADVHTGTIEPIIVTATSINTLSDLAISTVYPDDTLLYELIDTTSQGGDRGRIMFRKDNLLNIAIWYDWRNVIFRRWETSPSSGVFTVTTDNGGAFKDYPTFNPLANVHDVVINNFIDGKLFTTKLNNNVFLTDESVNDCYFDSNSYGNTFLKVCVSNTFGSGCQNNSIILDFVRTNVGGDFIDNTFEGVVQQNTIAYGFTDNVLGGTFSNNNIGDNFQNNNIAVNFSGNKTSVNFSNNIIDSEFAFNIILQFFRGNTVGINFQYNLINAVLDGNTFGTDCANNLFNASVINSVFNDSLIDAEFKTLVSGVDFSLSTLIYDSGNHTIIKGTDVVDYITFYNGISQQYITPINS
jgi:hypothetical protein